jgi:iron-sulfur cluster assembly protein
MIVVSSEAVEQIKQSVAQSNAEGLALRIAVERRQDGSFHYMMGFDENLMESDEVVDADGVKVVIDNASQQLAKGMRLDYVDIDGKMEFVFMNPNDPAYKQPEA